LSSAAIYYPTFPEPEDRLVDQEADAVQRFTNNVMLINEANTHA
jgi:hypothetical protein